MTSNIFYSKGLPKFDNKLVLKSFIILFILVIPFNIIHETNHNLICLIEGKTSQMNITLFGASLQCFGNVEHKTIFRISGGLLASIIAIMPFLIIKKTLKKYPFISVTLLSMAISQFSNGIIEGFFNEDYIHNGISIYLIYIIQYASFIYFIYYFTNKTNQNNIVKSNYKDGK